MRLTTVQRVFHRLLLSTHHTFELLVNLEMHSFFLESFIPFTFSIAELYFRFVIKTLLYSESSLKRFVENFFLILLINSLIACMLGVKFIFKKKKKITTQIHALTSRKEFENKISQYYAVAADFNYDT